MGERAGGQRRRENGALRFFVLLERKAQILLPKSHQCGLLFTSSAIPPPEAAAHANGVVAQAAPAAVQALCPAIPAHDIRAAGALHLGAVCAAVAIVALAAILLQALIAIVHGIGRQASLRKAALCLAAAVVAALVGAHGCQ